MGRSAGARVAEQRAHAIHQRRHCWFPEGFDTRLCRMCRSYWTHYDATYPALTVRGAEDIVHAMSPRVDVPSVSAGLLASQNCG